jgi:hypothetical protein
MLHSVEIHKIFTSLIGFVCHITIYMKQGEVTKLKSPNSQNFLQFFKLLLSTIKHRLRSTDSRQKTIST